MKRVHIRIGVHAMERTISARELRANLKAILDEVESGTDIHIAGRKVRITSFGAVHIAPGAARQEPAPNMLTADARDKPTRSGARYDNSKARELLKRINR